MLTVQENIDSLEEILFTVDIPRARETLVCQERVTVGALETFWVPMSIQHLQNKLIQDVLTAACALRDLWRNTRTESDLGEMCLLKCWTWFKQYLDKVTLYEISNRFNSFKSIINMVALYNAGQPFRYCIFK